jgi:hypothetical protein
MEGILLIANYNGVAGIIAALIADYIFNSVTENICCFSLDRRNPSPEAIARFGLERCG